MDDTSGKPPANDSHKPSRLGQIQHAIAGQAEKLQRLRPHFEPIAKEQIARLFPGYDLPLASQLIFASREKVQRDVAEKYLIMSTQVERPLTDEETKAVIETTLNLKRISSTMNITTWGLAGFFEFRGRKNGKLPLYQPSYSPLWHPATAKQPYLAALRIGRFAAYFVFIGYLFGINTVVTGQAYVKGMLADSRMSGLVRELQQQKTQRHPGAPVQGESMGTYQTHSQRDYQQNLPTMNPAPSYSRAMDSPDSGTRESSYPRTAYPVTETHTQQRYEGSDIADLLAQEADDASPIAPAARNQSNSPNSGGSTWDQIRQRALGGQGQQTPQVRSQQSQNQSQASQAYWGSEAGTSPEYRGQRESYSYSNSEEESATAKSQAQREFDQLLERERKGSDQERRSWNSR